MPRPDSAKLRVLLPIAIGHVAAVAMVAAAVPAALRLRAQLDGPVLLGVAAALLLVLALHRLAGATRRTWGPLGQLGLALWSFFMGTAHGAGLMLVPALAPLCFGQGSAGGGMESGPLVVALAAASVHVAAMLAVTAAMAAGVQRALDFAWRWRRRAGVPVEGGAGAGAAVPASPRPTGFTPANMSATESPQTP